MDHVQHEERDAAPAEDVGVAQELERAERGRREPTLEDDADLLLLPGDDFVEPALEDVAARGRQSRFELLRLLRVGGRRMADPAEIERVALQPVARADGGPDIVLADHRALNMCGADAQADHRRQV